jgi:polar amino acid transport system substrate-binding protein
MKLGKFAAIASALLVAAGMSIAPLVHADDSISVPAPGVSKRIDDIKARGTLRVGVLPDFPWLVQNMTGSGEPFSGPAWMLAKEYASRLGVKLETVPVSHETKVPILASGQVDMTIAPLSETDQRKKVVDFVIYSNSSLCMFGKADNPKLKDIKTVADLNRSDIVIAYFTGAAEEFWIPQEFPKAQHRSVTSAGTEAPVEEIMSGRADVAPDDKISLIELKKKISGLVTWPSGDACLTSTLFSQPVGLAIDKGQQAFLDWLTAVQKKIEPQLQAEELQVMKAGQ